MENNENSNLSELDQLKTQYETLKQQFDQQEIVNDRLLKSSIKRNVDFFMRYRWRQYILYPIALLGALLITKWEFGNNLSLRLFCIAYLVLSFAVEIWMLRKLHVKTLENNDLLTLSNQARSFKLFYTLLTILSGVPMLILTVGLFAHAGYDHFPGFARFLIVLCVMLVFFVGVGVMAIRTVTRPCDEIIRQIEASETAANKTTGFDKRQKWFCVVMFVAFLCLDVWAYMIVASHLKLPPMWQTVEYVRPADDHSTEGKLAIWEVFADTVVPEKDVPELLQILDPGRCVLMRGQQRKVTIEVGNEAIHSWRLDENNLEEVRLYLLKKNSQEGPAISTEVLGGKPMVQRVDVTKPCKYPSNGSVPMIVHLTPEASQLWYELTTHITGHRAVLAMDGVVIQDWKLMCGLDNGSFFIMKEWSSKEELDAFCEQLIRQ